MSTADQLPPGMSHAGADFNYAVWSANSRATLFNVPWNNDYRDIVRFESQAALNAYLDRNTSAPINIATTTYLRANEPIRLDVPFDRAYKFNYLRVHNGAQPTGGDAQYLYYFIVDVIYRAPNTTEFVVQLDVWQTFGYDIRFGRCYIERGHIGIANSNSMVNNGRNNLSIPEGLELGSEYGVAMTYTELLASVQGTGQAVDTKNVDILMATTVSLEGSGGDINNPTLKSAQGSTWEGLPNGAELYWFPSVESFHLFVQSAKDLPWVMAGIVSITAIPSLTPTPNTTPAGAETLTTSWGVPVHRMNAALSENKLTNLMPNDWRDTFMRRHINGRYKNLKKFLTAPYTMVELTTYAGNPLLLRPENMNGDGLDVVQMTHLAPPSPRVAFYPYKYGALVRNDGILAQDTKTWDGRLLSDNAEFLDMTTGFFDLPTFSVVNNAYLQYMASNRNAIAYQHSSADWSQQKALQGATLANQQAGQNIGTAQQMAGSAMLQNNLTTAYGTQRGMMSAGVNALGGVAQGAMSGNPGALAGAMAGGAMSLASQEMSNQTALGMTALANSGISRNQRIQQSNSEYMRDTNLQFAQFAATGDYENAIASINARTQDAKMIQPTTAGQVGGDAFMLATYQWAIHAKVKHISGYTQFNIGEYWLRYGYAIQRFIVPPADLHCMQNFTYWKMRETYIASSRCPETFKQAIRGIFEKGVTVWKEPDHMHALDIADNEPLNGVSY